MYGPKGVGALYVRRPRSLEPILDGGGHERGMRSGTLAVANIVGLGEACDMCRAVLSEESERCRRMRDRLHDGLLDSIADCNPNGHPAERLPGNVNVSFAEVQGRRC